MGVELVMTAARFRYLTLHPLDLACQFVDFGSGFRLALTCLLAHEVEILTHAYGRNQKQEQECMKADAGHRRRMVIPDGNRRSRSKDTGFG